MKRRSLWVTSILSLLVVITLAFQNCNNKKFANTVGSNLKGSMDSMNDNVIDGEIISELCNEEDEIENCPATAKVNFYAIESNGTKPFIGDTQANLTEQIVDGVKSYSYIFSYTVPAQHTCKDIEARVVDPITKAEVVIQPKAGFIMWGDKTECETFDPETPNPNGAAVDIVGAQQDGRLVEIFGTCKTTAPVKFTGDLNALIFKDAACANDSFKHCDLLTNDNVQNTVVAKQTVGNNTAQDSHNIMGKPPILVFTFDSFVKNGDTYHSW